MTINNERNGVCNLFMFSEPAWVHEVTERRTKQDYAQQMKYLDVRYPDVDLITVVHDQLNTHVPAQYLRFEPAVAKRIQDTTRVSLH